MNKPTLTVSELAEALNISLTGAYQLARRADFFPAFQIGSRWVISVKALERWLEEQTEEKAPCAYPAKSTAQRT